MPVPELVAILIVATAAFGIAVWFGLHFIAPRFVRALDRAEDDEEPGDRSD